METKQYKNLGNTIRDSVFRTKEAPTMLPDETIEKLGLGEDDILSMEDDDDEQQQQAIISVNLDEITAKEADKLSNAARGYDEAWQEASHVAQLLRELVTSVNRLAKSPHGKTAKKYAKIFQDTLNHTKRFKTLAKSAAKDLQKQADDRWKDDKSTRSTL